MLTDDADNRARIGVRMVAHPGPHGYENTQGAPTQQTAEAER